MVGRWLGLVSRAVVGAVREDEGRGDDVNGARAGSYLEKEEGQSSDVVSMLDAAEEGALGKEEGEAVREGDTADGDQARDGDVGDWNVVQNNGMVSCFHLLSFTALA